MLSKGEPIKISDIAETISPFIVMDVLEKAKELERKGERIIHLEIGEPDFDTPEPIKKAAAEALEKGLTHYTHSQGLLELREEISHYYHKTYSVQVDPDRIIVTSGTSPAMLLVLSAVINPGDEVLITDPYYSCYPNFIKYVGGKPVTIKVFEEKGFRLSVKEVKRHMTPKTRALIINSPSNPTGVIMPPEDLEALAELPVAIVSDEIYHGLTYGEKARSMLEFSSKAIVINGFSKLFAMTGWRLGYAIVPPELVRPIRSMQQNLFICATSFVQKAGIAALKYCDEHVEKMRQEYDRRRKFTLEKIKETGLKVASSPTGAFYILANAKEYSMDSYNLAFDILQKVGVAVTPGIDFGPNAEGYLRISYANSIENIAEGMERLKRYFQGA
ncbi:MAG: pyridoxal phosphate-dependent aminotransferase [Clostridia bacterium]|nr:pyridoxal phosphate-dependent aminotransferase [Clostridia bacterium]